MKKFAQGVTFGVMMFLSLCVGLSEGSESADKQWCRCFQSGIPFDKCYQAIR